MQSVTAMFRNGRVELTESVDWPEGIRVEVRPLATPEQGQPRVEPPLREWPAGFFERLRQQWGEEAFERPRQGETEVRGDW